MQVVDFLNRGQDIVRYPPEHKASVRRRIVEKAARLFRRYGYQGVSIDRLMDAAGLTRGGFYSHFRNKADLFACAIEHEPEFTERLRDRTGETERELREQALEIAQNYVSKEYRKQVLKGCSLASLAMETSRAPAEAQRRYAQVIRELAGEFDRGNGTGSVSPRSLATISTAIGALLLANATAADKDLSDKISSAAQEELANLLAIKSRS